MGIGLVITDDEGNEVELDEQEATCLFVLTDRFEGATVSACPDCRCRVLAAVALIDLLAAAPPHPRTSDLVDLADDAPTLHLYVIDEDTECEHPRWLDPLCDEWLDAVESDAPRARR